MKLSTNQILWILLFLIIIVLIGVGGCERSNNENYDCDENCRLYHSDDPIKLDECRSKCITPSNPYDTPLRPDVM